MPEGALPVGIVEVPQHQYPALMKRVEQSKRNLCFGLPCFGQFGPAILKIWFDGWFFFSQRKLEADVRIHVAVRDVMDDLAHGPSAIAVRRVELLVVQAANCSAQVGWRLLYIVEVLTFLLGSERARIGKLADGIAWITHGD